MNTSVRVRFAPSPTGYLHVGGLRMALFDFFIARHYGGQCIFRLEDTDKKRQIAGAAEKLYEVFAALDLHFDEGPGLGGNFGPYVQSERQVIYDQYIKELLAKNEAYYCFCSAEKLTSLREEQNANKLPPRYNRACRDLSHEEVEAKIATGETYTIRQKMPLSGEVVVHDEIHGDISFKAENLEDHVLIKSDGMPTYQFANVVDDHLMEITHIVRGDEWISSFPKNILLYQAFGWSAPKYIHAPLILNKEGGKLSKRQGDVSVEDFLAKGYLKETMINFCGLLGWHPKGEEEILTFEQICEQFKIEDIGTSPAIFDLEKLDYLNGYYLRQLDHEQLLKLVVPYLVEAKLIEVVGQGYINNQTGEALLPSKLKLYVALAQDRMKKLSDIGELTEFLFIKPHYDLELLKWKQFSYEDIKTNLKDIYQVLENIPAAEWTKHSTSDACLGHIKNLGKTNGEYLWPLRVALTGHKASPGPFEVAEALDKDQTLVRLRFAIEKLGK
ncbi:MAG: glutamate--tRNA ligase [bacterium]